MKHKLFAVIFSVALIFVSTLFFTDNVFATCHYPGGVVVYCDGDGEWPSGGRCGKNGEVWDDTCFGVSWQHYEYSGTADVTLPGSAHAGRTTVSGKCGEFGGFWVLAYEQYKVTDQTKIGSARGVSQGKQYGTYRVEGVKDPLGGGTTPFYYSTNKPTTTAGGAKADRYGSMAEVKAQYEIYHKDSDTTTGKSTTWESLGWFCAGELKDKPEDKPQENKVSCDGLVTDGPYYGSSASLSVVTNLSNGKSGTAGTGKSSTAEVFAKPGDLIQFKHVYCYGNQGVYYTSGTMEENYLKISSSVDFKPGTMASSSKYIMDIPDKITGGAAFRTSQPIYADAVSYSGHSITVTSPVKAYSCQFNSTTVGYQINGFQTGSCKPGSKNNAIDKSNVGTVISQTAEWADVQAWINVSTADQDTGCGCDDPYPDQPAQTKISTYAKATQGVKSPQKFGVYHPADCTRSATRNCNPGCSRGAPCYSSYWYDCCSTPCIPDGKGGCSGYRCVGSCLYCSPSCYRSYTYYNKPKGSGYRTYPMTSTTKRSSQTVKVNIPFNFTTSVWASITNDSEILYAGEEFDVSAGASINVRSNSQVGGSAYATITPSNSEIRVSAFTTTGNSPINYVDQETGSACSGSGCVTLISDGGPFNASGNLHGSTESYSGSFRVPDVLNNNTSTKLCVVTAISKHKTTNDTGSIASGWHVSSASCRTIVKKPTVQIQGNNFYTAGKIESSTTEKVPNASLSGARWNGATAAFSSWSEFGIVTKNRSVVNFASGAATSTSNSSKYYGTTPNQDFCSKLSPLTISNNCTGSYAGNGNVTVSTSTIDRIYSRYANEDANVYAASGDISASSVRSATQNIANGKTIVIYAKNGKVTIGSDIKLDSKYTSINAIPQVIIIAKNGIDISESVGRIDAWLITDGGTINTCAGFSIGSLSTTNCYNQLVVNGPVIANNIVLNRTAGAGAGYDSNIPAEIFNFTPLTYLWSYRQAQNYSQASVTYIRELAPRL